ncbi:MAG: DUF599 family protein [Cellvibrionaceae bacterium]
MSITDSLSFLQLNSINILAIIWFFACYRGYFRYTQKKSRTEPTLAFAMHRHRRQWVRQALVRENRIADTNTIATLQRHVSFFASTTLLILAGLVTILGSSDKVSALLADVPFSNPNNTGEWEAKISLLVCLFVYAFFKFTWSLRQYGFVAVMLGGAPTKAEMEETKYLNQIDSISKMASKAGGNFNNGLRTYYFSMAILGWFVNAWIFMLLALLIVIILYRREFKSETLKTLLVDLPG